MKYLICGLAPGNGGVPKLMEFLNNNLDSKRVKLIYPKYNYIKSKNKLINNRVTRSLREKLLDLPYELKIIQLKNKDVIILHPQSLGLKKTRKLIEQNNVTFYVMDNSFFCIKTYNFIDSESKACLRCLGGTYSNAKEMNCRPFPVDYSVDENIDFLVFLQNNAEKMSFLTLSKENACLVNTHFEKVKRLNAIYFLTEDILEDLKTLNQKSVKEKNYEYDLVFHGADIAAKGFDYFLKLSGRLNEFKIFIPTSKEIVVNNNIILQDAKWESGLKKAVINSKLVFTPSLWSNTPEASTLKSFLFNGSVAMMCNKFGFSNEIPEDSILLLSGNIDDDEIKVREFINKKEYVTLADKGRTYVNDYLLKAEELMKKEFPFKKNKLLKL